MEDHYVLLLQRVIDENTRLREAIEARDNEQKRVLEELSAKLESNSTSTPARITGRKRKRTITVSPQCRQDFRKMYKVLKENETFKPGFILDERFTSEENQNVTKTVIEAVVGDYCGVDKCPWSTAELKSAAATYFKSLHDSSSRAKTGKLERHGTLCRRQGRRRDKIQRRLSSLKGMPWSVEKKKEIEKAVGSMEYTSSDESDWSEDENGELRHSGFLVKKLPWERTCLKNAKQHLDEAYMRGLNQRARQNLAIRRVHHLPSTRRPPTEPLEWAVRVLPTTRPAMPSGSSPGATPAATSPGIRPATTSPSIRPETTSLSTRPVMPSTGVRPTTPSTGTRPAAPSTGTRPATPYTGTRPVTPSTGTRPATSSTGTRPAAFSTGTRPAAASTGTRPATSSTGTRPAAPSTGTRSATSYTGTRPSKLLPENRSEKTSPGTRIAPLSTSTICSSATPLSSRTARPSQSTRLHLSSNKKKSKKNTCQRSPEY